MAKASSVKRLPSGRLQYNGETFPGFNKVQRTPGQKKKFKVLAKKGTDVKRLRLAILICRLRSPTLRTRQVIVPDRRA